MIRNLSTEQVKLENLMSNISEECYHASWMKNLEYVLWDAVINGERKYGQGKISKKQIEELILVSNRCKSWIYHDEKSEITSINLEHWRDKFSNIILTSPEIIIG